MNKLLLSLAVIFLLITQACKKKEEEPAAPTVTQLESVEFDNSTSSLNDLTTGTSYTINEAIQNPDNIDIAYLKLLPYTNSENKPDTAYKAIISPSSLTSGGQQLFNNQTTFVPTTSNTNIKEITDGAQLKTLYDEAKAAVGRESIALEGMVPNAIILFKIRQQTSTPKYGGFVINSISSDSLKLNVSIAVQK